MKKWQKGITLGILTLGISGLSQLPKNVSADGNSSAPVIAKSLQGWVKEGNTWKYYKNQKGVNGWLKTGNVWYYFNQKGVMQTGWQKISGVWYYFNNNGYMMTGWQKISNVWYFFNNNGNMKTGWLKTGNMWYFFNPSGSMKTGWLQTGNTWYYFNGSGNMKTGWQKISGVWYYFNPNGSMKRGWLKSFWQKTPEVWYYFNNNGSMKTGWLKLGKNWYYFRDNGIMKTGSLFINRNYYQFSKNGVLEQEGTIYQAYRKINNNQELVNFQKEFNRLLNDYRASYGLHPVQQATGFNWVSQYISDEKAIDFSDFAINSNHLKDLAEKNGQPLPNNITPAIDITYTVNPLASTLNGKETAKEIFHSWRKDPAFNKILLGNYDIYGVSNGTVDTYRGQDTIWNGTYVSEVLGVDIFAFSTASTY